MGDFKKVVEDTREWDPEPGLDMLCKNYGVTREDLINYALVKFFNEGAVLGNLMSPFSLLDKIRRMEGAVSDEEKVELFGNVLGWLKWIAVPLEREVDPMLVRRSDDYS